MARSGRSPTDGIRHQRVRKSKLEHVTRQTIKTSRIHKSAKEGLTASEEKYRHLCENIPLVVYSALPDELSTTTYISAAVEDITGYSSDEFVRDPQAWGKIVHCEDRDDVWNAVREHRSEKVPLDIEYRVVTNKGGVKWVRDKATPVLDEEGEIVRIDGLMEDITERKKAEVELQYRLEFEAIVTGISTEFINLVATQIDDRINRALKTIGEFIGADRSYVFQFHDDGRKADNTHEWCAEGIGPQIENLKGIVIDDELPWFGEIMRRREVFKVPCVARLPAEAKAEKEHFESQGIQSLIVVPMVCRDRLIGFVGFDSVRSVRKWQSESVSLLRVVGEIFAGALNRKLKENALRDSEERFHTLFECAPDGIYLLDMEGRFVDGNRIAEELTGYAREELIGKDFREASLLTPDQMAKAVLGLQNNISGKPSGPDEFRLTRKDGSYVDVEIRTFPVQMRDGPFVLGIARNITDRKKVQELIAAEKNKLQSILGAMHNGVTIRDLDYNLIYQNHTIKDIYGERIGEKCYRVFQGIDQVCDGCPVELAYKDGKSHTSIRKVQLPTGEITFWENTANPIRDASGEIVSCLEVNTNITERKRAEQTVLQSEEKYRQLVSTTTDAVLLFDAETRQFVEVNLAAEQLYGYSREEFLNLRQNDISAEPEESDSSIQQLLEGNRDRVPVRYHRKKDGTVFPVEISGSTFETSGRKVICGVIRDITERKRAESVVQMERDKLTAIFESMEDGIYIANKDHDIQYINPVLKKDFGSLEGKKCYEYFHDSDEPCTFCNNEEVFAGKMVRWEWTFPKNSRTYDLIDTPIKNADGSISKLEIFRDFTERKRAEEALRVKDYYLSRAQEIGSIGTWDLDIKKNRLVWTDENYRILGIPTGTELTYETFMDCVHPDDREYVDRKWKAAFNKEPYDIEHRLLVDGNIKWVREKAELEFDKEGNCVRGTGFTQDITAKKNRGRIVQKRSRVRKHFPSGADWYWSGF